MVFKSLTSLQPLPSPSLPPKKTKPTAWTRGSSSTLLLFLLLFLSWVDSSHPDGGVSSLPVPPAAVYGNRDRELLPNREKSRIGLTLNWVGSTISISTKGAEKPALICGGNVNHLTIRERESCTFAFELFFSPPFVYFCTNYRTHTNKKYEWKLTS